MSKRRLGRMDTESLFAEWDCAVQTFAQADAAYAALVTAPTSREPAKQGILSALVRLSTSERLLAEACEAELRRRLMLKGKSRASLPAAPRTT